MSAEVEARRRDDERERDADSEDEARGSTERASREERPRDDGCGERGVAGREAVARRLVHEGVHLIGRRARAGEDELERRRREPQAGRAQREDDGCSTVAHEEQRRDDGDEQRADDGADDDVDAVREADQRAEAVVRESRVEAELARRRSTFVGDDGAEAEPAGDERCAGCAGLGGEVVCSGLGGGGAAGAGGRRATGAGGDDGRHEWPLSASEHPPGARLGGEWLDLITGWLRKS